ncbi:MAG: hypothetical protein WBQ57_05900, partial [Rhodanobacteraceae bacterium]
MRFRQVIAAAVLIAASSAQAQTAPAAKHAAVNSPTVPATKPATASVANADTAVAAKSNGAETPAGQP